MSTELVTMQQEAKDILQTAESFNVASQETYNSASIFLKSFMEVKKKIENFFEPTINNFKEAKAKAEKGRKDEIEKMEQFLGPIKDAIAIVRGKCKDFEDEQSRKAEAERAEREKIAEEKKQKLLKEAEIAKNSMQPQKSAELVKKATIVEKEKMKPDMTKNTNLGIIRRWKWKVVDENLIPRTYWYLNQVEINKEVATYKGNTNIPGIEAYKE